MAFGKNVSDEDKGKAGIAKIFRRQRSAREADKYGFKARKRSEEQAKIRRGQGW